MDTCMVGRLRRGAHIVSGRRKSRRGQVCVCESQEACRQGIKSVSQGGEVPTLEPSREGEMQPVA